MQPFDLFDDEARKASERHLSALSALQQFTVECLPGDATTRTFLARPMEHASAQALKSYSTVFISEQLLSSAPSEVIRAVALHEVVHLLLGEVAGAVRLTHRDVTEGFHHETIPAWLSGEALIRADVVYQSEKGWRQLLPEWRGPTSIDPAHARRAGETYFALLKKGLVYIEDGRVDSLPPLLLHRKDLELRLPSPKDAIICVATGFELLAYLDECIRDTLACIHGIDLGTWEEGLANYVATQLVMVQRKPTFEAA